MLSFSGITRSDFRKILGIRNEDDNLEQKMLDGGTNFGLAHETFATDISSLREPGIPLPERTGLRVIEVDDNAFSFIYDIHEGSGTQMFRDEAFSADYEQAFEIIAESDRPEFNYTVQTLRIPALYIDALWLHVKGHPSRDKFIPVLSIPGLEKHRVYDRNGFFSIVRDAAQNVVPGDELSGG